MYLACSAVNQVQANFCKAPPPTYTPCPLDLLEKGKLGMWGYSLFKFGKAVAAFDPSTKILTNPIATGMFIRSYGEISFKNIAPFGVGVILNAMIGGTKAYYDNRAAYYDRKINLASFAVKIGTGAVKEAIKGAVPSLIGAGIGLAIAGPAGAVAGAKISGLVAPFVRPLTDKAVDYIWDFVDKHKQEVASAAKAVAGAAAKTLAGAAIGVIRLPAVPFAAGFILGSWVANKFLK